MKLDYNEMVLLSRALFWYMDKVSNIERSRGRDDAEWDKAHILKQRLADAITTDAYI